MHPPQMERRLPETMFALSPRSHGRFSTATLLLVAGVLLPATAIAQQSHSSSSDSASSSSAASSALLLAPPEVTNIPSPSRLSRIADGLDTAISVTGLHDSETGYSTLFTTNSSYSFNDTYSLDAEFTVYFYRLAPSLAPNPPPGWLLVTQRGDPGDLIFGLHGQWSNPAFDYLGTFAFTVPTGDETYGLSTGHMTFDYTNHFEHPLGIFVPDIEIGIGDSTELSTRNITQNYNSLGALSHFQAGTSVDLFRGLSFSADAYEQLPIGDQKIYQSVRQGRIFATVVTGHNLTEDNGFTTSLDIPLGGQTALSGYYSRSLRLHMDTAAVSLSYTFHKQPADSLEDNVAALFR
jgi:hypothetical protein